MKATAPSGVLPLLGGKNCTSSGRCPVVACRVFRWARWCFGGLVLPAGASRGPVAGGASGGTLCPPVPHRERLVPAAPRGGVAKTRRCLMGNIWVRFFPLLCARSLARPCLAQAEYISQRTEHFSQRVRSSCDCKNCCAKTVLVQVWECTLCFERCSRHQ